MALHDQVERLAVPPGGEAPPGGIERAVRSRIGGDVPHLHADQLFHPEVGARVEPQHVHALLQQADEGHEQRPVEPVLVEFVRLHIGGRDHHHAALEHPGEQPAEDHGVGDVGHVELVEAQHPGLVGEVVGGEVDRVAGDRLAVFQLRGGRR